VSGGGFCKRNQGKYAQGVGVRPHRVAPAFNYCRDTHTTELVKDSSVNYDDQHDLKAVFKSKDLSLDLRYKVDASDASVGLPSFEFKKADYSDRGLLGEAIQADFELEAGQAIYFVLRQYKKFEYASQEHRDVANPSEARAKSLGLDLKTLLAGASKLRPAEDPVLTRELLVGLQNDTLHYWQKWISKSKYQGRWREVVHRSALTLKMLVFEETGAIVAAPTFSLPENIGGSRNWDYRFTWVRDASFTLYALIRLGFTDEANAYMDFILARLKDRVSENRIIRCDAVKLMMATITGIGRFPPDVSGTFRG
jgi:hypothetical protein